MTLTRSGCGCGAPCGCATSGPMLDPATGADPRVRVRFVDGALLDATDLRVEQNAHLWRDRLHHVLLHGAGVIWGLSVEASEEGRMLRVSPGAAVDPRGRLLLLDRELCLDLRRIPGSFTSTLPEQDGLRRAYVVLTFDACVAEPVAALRPVCAEPQGGSWRRQIDACRIDLAAEAPEPPIAWIRRWLGRLGTAPEQGLGRWLGSEPAAADVRDRWLALSMAPARSLPAVWEEDAPVPLLLAAVDLQSSDPSADELRAAAIDPSGRALLPPVQLLAEWLLGTELASGPAPSVSAVRVTGWAMGAAAIEVSLSAPLDPATVSAGVELLALAGGSWSAVAATVTTADRVLTVTPGAAPASGTPIQLVLRGTGSAALLGSGGLPFAGDTAPTALPRASDLVLVATWS